jgi:hypothetical protein
MMAEVEVSSRREGTAALTGVRIIEANSDDAMSTEGPGRGPDASGHASLVTGEEIR